MPLTKIPSRTTLVDGQFIQVEGPDQLLSGFQYDSQQRMLYAKESQVIFPSHHGLTHISEDPIPTASCDSVGLMSADDKCKLDSLLQTRIGVLGFMGAGFSDDGGWMQGEIILAAGTEFISLERIGNVIRFTVDTAIPLNCNCFLPGARVLMHNGTTKAIEDIATGDLVVTHKGRVRRVTNLFRTPHAGPVYSWHADKHSGEGFTVTGNHPVLALERSAAFMPSGKVRKAIKETPRWIEAANLSAGDIVARRRSHNYSAHIQMIDILAELGDGFVERDGLVYSVRGASGKNCHSDTLFIDGCAVGVQRFLPITDDFLDLIGYYAAEGCASRRNGVRFSVHTNEMVAGDIGGELCRIIPSLFGLEPAIRERSNTVNGRDIQVQSVALGALFRKWFGQRKDKCFPDWVMTLPAQKQARILAAFLRGDGYVATHPAGAIYFNLGVCSRALIDQSLFIAERCGWEPANPAPTVYRGRVRYRLTISASNAPDLCDLMKVDRQVKKLRRERRAGDEMMHRLVEVAERHYDGTVYNFEVEQDNSYVVDGIVVHNCEACVQLYWVQDETDISAIRPPTCGGKLPGTNSYGELKIYLFPESTIVDPANAAATLNNKWKYPALIFKRYDDALTPGTAEYEMVLKRNANNQSVTEVGQAMTPGPAGIPEMVWFMGLNDDGDLIRFDLDPVQTPGVLGGLLFNGHLLTKQMAVVTDYTPTVLTNNQYRCRLWDVLGAEAVGDVFIATNTWRYLNPESVPNDPGTPQSLVLDVTSDVLPLGTLIDIWKFQIGEVASVPVYRYFFKSPPVGNMANVWTMVGSIQFGDEVEARGETENDQGSASKTDSYITSGINDFEETIWGLTGFDVPLMIYSDVADSGTTGAAINTQHRAIISTGLPGLAVTADAGTEPFSQRPVMLWNRIGLDNSMLIRAEIGRPDDNAFTPYDILLHAPIENHDNVYMKVAGVGSVNGVNFVRLKGATFQDLPQRGALRIINDNTGKKNHVFNYANKLMFPSVDDDSIALIASADDNRPFPGSTNDIVELLHREYTAPCVRLHFTNDADGTVRVQVKVGILGMDTVYEDDLADDRDDYVRGLQPGYSISAEYSQDSSWSGSDTQPPSSVDGFYIYDGGRASDNNEYWNVLEIMLRQGQVWVWWNGLLIPPSSNLSSSLPTPVQVITPYYPVTTGRVSGKFGMRLWPGAKIRRASLRTQPRVFSEFTYGQLLLT